MRGLGFGVWGLGFVQRSAHSARRGEADAESGCG